MIRVRRIPLGGLPPDRRRARRLRLHPTPTGVVLQIEATGVCHSDYHGWTGDDPYPSLPHVPGHEMVGTVAEVGRG